MTYSIRPLAPSDEPFLWEMLYLALFVPQGSPPPDRNPIAAPELAKYVQSWGRAGDLGFAAVDDTRREPVGAAWLRLFGNDERGYGFVDAHTPELSIALLPSHRGRGLGRRLMEHLIEAARLAYPALSLSVSPDNPALHLYQQLGFIPVRQSGRSVTMRLSLKPAGPS